MFIIYKLKCRVCGQEIGFYGWSKHVESHKKQFCKDNGINKEEYYKIEWEQVVKFYNPKEALTKLEKSALKYAKEKTKIRRLTDYAQTKG